MSKIDDNMQVFMQGLSILDLYAERDPSKDHACWGNYSLQLGKTVIDFYMCSQPLSVVKDTEVYPLKINGKFMGWKLAQKKIKEILGVDNDLYFVV